MDKCREGARNFVKQAISDSSSLDIYTQAVTTCNVDLEGLWSNISGHEGDNNVSIFILLFIHTG